MTPTPQLGTMERYLLYRRMDLSVNGKEEILTFAREQDAALSELTRQRDELLAACEKLVARGDGGHDSDNCAPMYGCSCGLEGELDAATAAIANARGTAVR